MASLAKRRSTCGPARGIVCRVPVRALPWRNQAGAIVGAVEIFEERGLSSETERRRDDLSKYGCQDECT